METDREIIAQMSINYYEQRTKNGRKRIVDWLRKQADFIENENSERDDPVSKKYIARLLS